MRLHRDRDYWKDRLEDFEKPPITRGFLHIPPVCNPELEDCKEAIRTFSSKQKL